MVAIPAGNHVRSLEQRTLGMRRWICFIAALAALAVPTAASAQGMPHEELSLDCSRCHQNADDRTDIEFDHSELEFELLGHHQVVGNPYSTWSGDSFAS